MAAGSFKFGLHDPLNDEHRSWVGHQRIYVRVSDVGAHRERVTDRGGSPGELIETDWMDMFIVRDPDGHQIVFAATDPGKHSEDPRQRSRGLQFRTGLPASAAVRGQAGECLSVASETGEWYPGSRGFEVVRGAAIRPVPRDRARSPIQPRRKLLTADLHYRKLENLYAEASVTRWYGATIRIEDGAAEVRIPVREEFLHAGGAVHGSVYFRALDDAAFFAANSRVDDAVLLTVSFHVHFTRPVDGGVLVATGGVMHEGRRLLIAEAELRDDEGRLLAKGSGTFARSLIALSEEVGYALPAGEA